MKLEIISRYPKYKRPSPPLLFVHGAFCGAWVWDEYVLPYFAECGYAAHAVSLRGHGASEGHEQLPWTRLVDYVADLREAISRLGTSPVLIGHSLGGVVVQKYIHRHTVPAAVLMASGPPHGMIPSTFGMLLRNPPLFQQMYRLQSLGPEASSVDTMRRALFSDSMPHHKVMEYFVRMQGESQRVAFDLTLPHLPPRRWNHDVPLLVLGAEQDAFVSPVMVRATAEVYRTTAEIFPNMAHAMMLELGWPAVAEHLRVWLDERVAEPAESVSLS